MRDDEHDTKESEHLSTVKKKVQERVKQEKASYPIPEKDNGTVSSKFVEKCIAANELGDGLLYAALLRGQFVFNNTTSEWLRWTGHHWERDIMDNASARVENVVDRLIEEFSRIGQQEMKALETGDEHNQVKMARKRKDITKRIYRLRTKKGRNTCLDLARTCDEPLAIRGDELDLNPYLLGCANGVMDLRTGCFRDGRPEDFIFLAAPHNWKDIEEPANRWEQFLLDIQDGDQEMISYIQRLLGYGITGQNVEHILPVLWGSGRNGKGKMVEVLNYVLGPLSGSIQSELLLDQRRLRSSAGPSPDIMALKGLRLAFASETEEGQRFSTSKVKWLTGGDQLVGRYPHDKYEIRFTPTHTLFLMTNHKPHASADDFAFWERVHLIPFRLAFVDRKPVKENERRADKYIGEKLKQEASGILAWLVRGCIEYQKRGLDPPQSVREATAQYRRDEDLLGDFLEQECILDPAVKIQAKTIYDRFVFWYKENVSEKNVPTPQKFGRILVRRFERVKEGGGENYYYGVDLK